MFQAEALKEHFEQKHEIRSNPSVYAEINLNDIERIEKIGNYRTLTSQYDPEDIAGNYTGADISYDVFTVDDSDSNEAEQIVFSLKDQFNSLFPLQDCFNGHRPRSGIVKPIYFTGDEFFDDSLSANRPRFYVSSRKDAYKYWTSYRKDSDGIERGVSNELGVIEGVAPFVVYGESLPTNRIVVKVQTGIGSEQRTFIGGDPFYGPANYAGPRDWRIEVLKNGMWTTATRLLNTPDPTGHVEIGYGLTVPEELRDQFDFKGVLFDESILPESAENGDAWLIDDLVYMWSEGWTTVTPRYEWGLVNGLDKSKTITEINNPYKYDTPEGYKFREFDVIGGIRVVVNTMAKKDVAFGLIEISPRLFVDLTNRTESFSVTKTMGDLGNSTLPVGSLQAGTGRIAINNNDYALQTGNAIDFATGEGSVLGKYINDEVKFTFYETVYNVDGMKYQVPLKTLYSEAGWEVGDIPDAAEFQLRDLYLLFEKLSAPEIMLEDVSLSRAVMVLLDNIGFSNYIFKKAPNEIEPIIPHFFVAPSQSVAEVLSSLSESTQSAMYFDEFNNFVVAFPGYLIPEPGVRETDLVLRGDDGEALANIEEISSAIKDIFNSGEIQFTKRYIQRTYGLQEASYQDSERSWIYQPVMVWEANGREATKASNEAVGQQSAFTLAAFPLRQELSDELPVVEGGSVVNNTIDVGESINYFSHYNGYVWANGEIIKFDAVQFNVTGINDVWITNASEYQDYLLGLPFGGRIYPTGLLKIYAEPRLTQNGELIGGSVKEHGRGQFGTPVKVHPTGLGEWQDNVNGMFQKSDYLFTLAPFVNYPEGLVNGGSGGQVRGTQNANDLARTSPPKNDIRNFLVGNTSTDPSNRVDHERMQSSALVLTGGQDDRDHISYTFKKMDQDYKSFGTRMRVIGEVTSTGDQTPVGEMTLVRPFTSSPLSDLAISGGSGGMGILVNPNTNSGYFMELAALTKTSGDYGLEEIDHEAALGNPLAISIVDNVVSVTVANASGVNVGDKITIEDLDTEVININGTYTVSNANGNVVEFVLPVIPFVFGPPFTSGMSITKAGVDIDHTEIDKIAIDDQGKALVTTKVDSGLGIGDLITVAGFEYGSSIPNINGTGLPVEWVSADKKQFRYVLAKVNLPDAFKNTLEGTQIVYGGITLEEADLDSITILDGVATVRVSMDENGNALTDVPQIPEAATGSGLSPTRENLVTNPRVEGVSGETSWGITNDARNPLAVKGKSNSDPGRWVPYTTTKAYKLKKSQEWLTKDGPSNIPSFTRVTYKKYTSDVSARGFLIAGDQTAKAAQAQESAISVDENDKSLTIGLWVHSSLDTTVSCRIKGGEAFGESAFSRETPNNAKTLNKNTWTWVEWTFTQVYNTRGDQGTDEQKQIKDIGSFSGSIYARISFGTTKKEATYSGTGLVIQRSPGLKPLVSGFFNGAAAETTTAVPSSPVNGLEWNRDNDMFIGEKPEGMESTEDCVIWKNNEKNWSGNAVRVWSLQNGSPYLKVNLGNLSVGHYIVSFVAYGETATFTPGGEATFSNGTITRTVRPVTQYVSGQEFTNFDVEVDTTIGGAFLMLPGAAVAGQSVWYDRIRVEPRPSTGDMSGRGYFDGESVNSTWSGPQDESTSLVWDTSTSKYFVKSIGGVLAGGAGAPASPYTVNLDDTSGALQDAAVGDYVVFSGTESWDDTTARRISSIIGGDKRKFNLQVVNPNGTIGTLTSPGLLSASLYAVILKPLKFKNTELAINTLTDQRIENTTEYSIMFHINKTDQTLKNPLKIAKVKKVWTEKPRLFNMFFYKTVQSPDGDIVPYRLWSGLSEILVDSGKLYGMAKSLVDEKTTVYDVNVSYKDELDKRVFKIYMNDMHVATVEDADPLPNWNYSALYARGQSKIMFEHFYGIAARPGQPDPGENIIEISNGTSTFDSIRHSGIASAAQGAIWGGLGDNAAYDVFYDEFGTIMREAAFMNVRYDNAYPALISKIAPAPVGMRGYAVSNFMANPYGAEFMIFNTTDSLLSLSDETGNYLRILGVTFTKDSSQTIDLYEYMKEKTNASLANPTGEQQSLYNKLRASRMRYGEKKFSLKGDYIQTTADAERLLMWVTNRVVRGRRNVGARVFPNPMLQLGDLVRFQYSRNVGNKEIDVISSPDKQFVVYNVTYEKSGGDTSMIIYATET